MTSFKPLGGTTVSLAVTTTTGRVQMTGAPKNVDLQVRLHNAGSATAFVRFGDVTITAATTDMPIPSGAIEVITLSTTDANPRDYMAAITASGTATVYATPGGGI